MRKTTNKDLPEEIEALIPEAERTPMINKILKEAREGEFHDFKNKKYTCGKLQLSCMLFDTKDLRLEDIRQAVMNGDYDESPDAEDKASMKKDWLENGGTEASYKELFGED